MRDKGDPVIHLEGRRSQRQMSSAELFWPPQPPKHGEVRYTPADGIIELKKAIFDIQRNSTNRRVEPENIIVSGGANKPIIGGLQAASQSSGGTAFSFPVLGKLSGYGKTLRSVAGGGYCPKMGHLS